MMINQYGKVIEIVKMSSVPCVILLLEVFLQI